MIISGLILDKRVYKFVSNKYSLSKILAWLLNFSPFPKVMSVLKEFIWSNTTSLV